jgi:hypothetical protein
MPIHAFLKLAAFSDDMDPSSIATALMGAQAGMMQLAVAARLERMNADQGANIAKLIDAADQNASALANLPATIGANLDVTA